jgi:hypothetical protein
VLVHGIRTTAGWYAEVHRVLAPHFEVVEIKYMHYRHPIGGAVGLVLHPPTLVAVGIAALVLALVAAAAPTVPALHGWLTSHGGARAVLARAVGVVTITALPLAWWLARGRLREAGQHVKREYDRKARRPGRPPHVIAHSLGTYLVGALVKTQFNARFSRAILLASVLPQDFDWMGVCTRKPAGVVSIRNETGWSDVVPRFAWVVRLFLWKLAPHIGKAGTGGFRGPPSIVHEAPPGGGPCPYCAGGLVAPVHNVAFPYEHTEYHEGDGQCAEHWLPTLLGIEPSVYSEFLELCHAAADLERDGDVVGVRLMERELLYKVWPWTRGKTLHDWFTVQLRAGTHQWAGETEVLRAADRAVGRMWRRVVDAIDAEQDSPDGALEARAFLHPLRAALAAVNAA